MRKFLLLVSLLSLTGIVEAELVPAAEFVAPQAVQDSKTNVIYYLESDHRHVAAIDSKGKILWCSEVLSEKESKYGRYIARIDANPGKDFITVAIWRTGFEPVDINKRTGALKKGRREVSFIQTAPLPSAPSA